MRPYVEESEMKSRIKGTGIGCVLVFACFFSVVYAQPVAIPEGKHCDECGMAVDRNSKFANEVIDEKGRKLFFCDLGDMLYHFRTSKNAIRAVYVKDYAGGAWIDGRKARYVRSKKFDTPMSWSIAAFRTDAEAGKWGNPVDFAAAFGLMKARLLELYPESGGTR